MSSVDESVPVQTTPSVAPSTDDILRSIDAAIEVVEERAASASKKLQLK